MSMDPYAAPGERCVGEEKPTYQHRLEEGCNRRSKGERQAEKNSVKTHRRHIKRRARKHLKEQLKEELSKLV